MGSSIPKQFLPLGGKPVAGYSIEAFESSDKISDIVIVCHEAHLSRMENIVLAAKAKKVRKLIAGGETRQGSSLIGLENCSRGTEYVLIHDAARPFLTNSLIEDLLAKAESVGASGPVIDLSDTVVEIGDGLVKSIPSRDILKRVQTPQAFKYDIILKAHKKAMAKGITSASDDCALVLCNNGKVGFVQGSEENMKITSALDMEIAEIILSRRKDPIKRLC